MGWTANSGADGLDYVFGDRRNFEHYAEECVALERLGIRTQVIGVADYLRQQPAFRDVVVGAMHFPGDAHLRPDRYTAELARANWCWRPGMVAGPGGAAGSVPADPGR